ncbi:MAG TPA: discoidin domain-containing protein [Verrucomicrobiae bacterium]|nr:discoidin domain-containing protein [Verrucomicrobiae bacterium]
MPAQSKIVNPKSKILGCFLAASLLTASASEHSDVISLAGRWQFELDRQNVGEQQRWFARKLTGTIDLPGSLPAQGIGDDISVETKWTGDIVDRSWYTAPGYAKYRQPGNVKVPFWLQPNKYYAGLAWYQRPFRIPRAWAGRRVVLSLERPHWETRVWVDGKEIGSNDSLSTAHEYELGTPLTSGEHQLTVRVNNSVVVDIGVNSHSITDHTQGNWNGIAGAICLRATAPVWIDELQVYPHVATRSITVKGRLGNGSRAAGQGPLLLACTQFKSGKPAGREEKAFEVKWTADGGTFEQEFPLGDGASTWDEFNPVVYRLSADVGPGSEKTVQFGLRELSTQGTQFVLNGRKIFFRGTLECCIFPKTGHPPTDVESWKRIIRIAKAHGLNLIRFHSWCPPEAAFAAADELGFYYQVEIASWANQSTTLGDGKPVDAWLYREAARILRDYGNHPCFMLMPYGNEPGGQQAGAFLAKWVEHWRAADPRRLYTSGSGWPQLAENQFHVTPDPRIQGWGEGLHSRINALPPETRTDYREYIRKRSVPVISHEIGQWCAYPDFAEIPEYTGYLKPKNFEIFRDSLAAHHMAGQARQFLLASGKLQTLCYKEEIESALRTPGMGGFELLDLHDFPGQGTALVGVLNPFWGDKGYVTAKEYSRFCNATVPLARLAKRVFTTEETLTAALEVAHFGPAPLTNALVDWALVDAAGKGVTNGEWTMPFVPLDNGIRLGEVRISLANFKAPAKYQLVVSIRACSGQGTYSTRAQQFSNDWDVWVYPSRLPDDNAEVIVATKLNADVLAALDRGGKVLLTVPAGRVKGDRLGRIAVGFSSIFWNTAWTGRQPPHTLGILCDPKHPALAEFPTEYHSNYQWWYLVHDAGAMILDDLPPNLQPLVQIIDDWVTNRKLALAFEARLGRGKLVVCSMDLENGIDRDPVVRQFRHSLLDYMASPRFRPAVELTAAQVTGLFTDESLMQKLGARIAGADSAQDGYPAANVLDGDETTFWHTSWEEPQPPFPHQFTVAFPKLVRLRGFTALPRQDGNHNGWIKDYAFYVSEDGQSWGEPVAHGVFSADARLKQVQLPRPVMARFVRFEALSGYANGPWASLAEFGVQ